jgi:large subunit ribosomal protein L22
MADITNNTKLVKASAKNLHVAPRKMRLVTNLLRGLPVQTALVQLQFVNKKAAPMVTKLLQSAIANAENNFSLDPSSLVITEITCDMGRVLKRYFPRARGSAFVIRRKLCHVFITLESKGGVRKRTSAPKATGAQKPEKVAKQPQTTTALPKEKNTPKTTTVKTAEQKKEQTIQQKRRLFNRDE